MTSTPPTYELDSEAQSALVALAMWDADFLRRSDGLIRPEYFSDEIEAGFVRLALEFWVKYREAPSAAAWRELVKEGFRRKPALWRDDRKAEVVAKLGETARLEIRSKGFLLDCVEEFAQQQEIMNAMIESAGALAKAGDPERFARVRERMTKAFKVGLHEGDEDYDYFARIEERTEERLEIAAGGRPKTGVTTGIPELDAMLLHGGWGRGEMSLFMGPAKAGKSFFLTFCAASAVQAGFNVLFVTLENSTAIQAQRIDAFFSDIAMTDFVKSPHTVRGVVESVARSGKVGTLKIRSFPTGTFKPKDLERLLEDYQTKGETFDICVVDYMDIMCPDAPKESEREASKDVYTRMRGIAGKYETARGKMALLSATQTNREGARAAVASMVHVSEDFNRVRLADLVIGINRTPEEKAEKKARLNLVASRNQDDCGTLFIRQDLAKGRAVDVVESVE